MASPVAPSLRWRSPSAGRQGGRTRGPSGPMAARTTSEGGSGLRRMIRSRTPHEVPAGAARVGDEVGGVVDGVGEDDGVAEPCDGEDCDGEDCDGEDFPNVSWGGAIARRA